MLCLGAPDLVPKLNVVGSIPITRSILLVRNERVNARNTFLLLRLRRRMLVGSEGRDEPEKAPRRASKPGACWNALGRCVARFPKAIGGGSRSSTRPSGGSRTGGGWPEDPLTMDCILVVGELHSLMRHMCVEDVAEIMAALRAAATTQGAERDAAIARLQELAVTDCIA